MSAAAKATDLPNEGVASEQATATNKHDPPNDDEADPSEDDLDDLDDMLNEFSSAKIDQEKPVPATAAAAAAAAADTATSTASAPGSSSNIMSEALFDLPPEEFEKKLQDGMAELMSELENSPDMQAQFDNIFKGLEKSEMPQPSGSGSSQAAGPDSAEQAAEDLSQDASFQDTIRRTMARMQESGDQATAAAAAGSSEDDFIAEMMKVMKDLEGGETGGDESFSKVLMNMMEQLTNKEILYEPMKELSDKFPDWIAKNKPSLSKDDLERYELQQTLVTEMVSKFEEPTFNDSNAADREYIVDRMQKMQAAGSPPADLVGDMPSAKEVLEGPDESCPTQ